MPPARTGAGGVLLLPLSLLDAALLEAAEPDPVLVVASAPAPPVLVGVVEAADPVELANPVELPDPVLPANDDDKAALLLVAVDPDALCEAEVIVVTGVNAPKDVEICPFESVVTYACRDSTRVTRAPLDSVETTVSREPVVVGEVIADELADIWDDRDEVANDDSLIVENDVKVEDPLVIRMAALSLVNV